MAPLVFPDVVRFSVVGSLLGQDCINVFDIKVEDTGVGGSRADEINRVAGDLLNQWHDHILDFMVDDYTALEVRFVDLDSASGVTGTVTSTDGADWPASGTAAGNGAPNNVYVKVVKQLDSHTRSARNGMTRLGGVPLSVLAGLDANQVTLAARDGIDAAFELLKDGINGVEGEWTINMGVLHTTAGTATGFTFISSFSTALRVGTIRRRMPGYGT